MTNHFLCVRTLPGKHLDKIAEQMRIHNINALLVVGGFEVCTTFPGYCKLKHFVCNHILSILYL